MMVRAEPTNEIFQKIRTPDFCVFLISWTLVRRLSYAMNLFRS
jgi:hypothetical protein